MKAGQGGSGGDLAITLITDVYIKAQWPITSETRSRAVEILKAFPPGEPTRKRFIQELVNWSTRAEIEGAHPERGDAELHHEIGVVLADEGEAYDAERHLLLGLVPQSMTPLVDMHYRWYREDSPHTAALYASRSVLPYLVLGNLKSANAALAAFTSQLLSLNPSIPTQMIESPKSSVRIFPSLPLLNFLSLLLLAVQKGDAGLFRQLAKHFAPHLKDDNELWSDALAQIGEIWFGIRIPQQRGNPLFDMMGSMLFGGNQSKTNQKTPAAKPIAAAKEKPAEKPVAMDLD